ncbi:hypothetical protein EII17_09090 [Clostridiales bacterium COT073_COT-073]|nr:hypothetical protein EII17_09090 [Clostridiales bacterium COT073_COT-073]
MNKKQILYLILTVLFILLNVSVIFSAIFSTPEMTLALLGLSFVLGVILYFLLRFHKKEKEYRKEIEELTKKRPKD